MRLFAVVCDSVGASVGISKKLGGYWLTVERLGVSDDADVEVSV